MSRASRWLSAFVVLLLFSTITAFGLSRSKLIKQRGFNPDEFEHLHFAWLASQGQVAYRDYFDHHLPLLHLAFAERLKQVDLKAEDSAVTALSEGRAVMLGLTLLALTMGAVFVARVSSAGTALGFVALLCSSSVFIAKTLEFRPDVPAMLFLVLALGLGASGRERLAGFACGLALLFTPKVVFAIAGLVASMCIRNETGRERLRALLFFAQGILGPLLAMLAWLFWADAVYPALRFAIVEAAHWSGPSPLPVAAAFVRTDAALSLLFILAAVSTMIHWSKTSALQRAALWMSVAGFSGLFLVTYPSRQFLLLCVPAGAILVALAFDRFMRRRFKSDAHMTMGHLVLGAIVVAVGFPEHVRAFERGNTGAVVALEQIARNTAPSETVVDGFLGYAPFRSHGRFFPFLHRDVRALRERMESPSLLQDLRSGRLLPKFALMNHYLQEGVEPAVWEFLEANYVPLDEDTEVRVRLFDNQLGYWDDSASRTLVPTARREPHVLTLGGWSGPREVEGRPGRWLTSAEPAVLLVPVRDAGVFDLSIELTTTAPLSVRVQVEDVRAELKDLSVGTRRYLVELPGHAWRSGLNRVAFTSSLTGRRLCFVSSVQLQRRSHVSNSGPEGSRD